MADEHVGRSDLGCGQHLVEIAGDGGGVTRRGGGIAEPAAGAIIGAHARLCLCGDGGGEVAPVLLHGSTGSVVKDDDGRAFACAGHMHAASVGKGHNLSHAFAWRGRGRRERDTGLAVRGVDQRSGP